MVGKLIYGKQKMKSMKSKKRIGQVCEHRQEIYLP